MLICKQLQLCPLPSLSAFITFTLQGCQTVLFKKLQCAKNERLRLFYCLTPLQQKMPIFLNFKPKLFSKKGRFWENVLDSFRHFLPLKSFYFQPQNRPKKCLKKHRLLPVFSIIFLKRCYIITLYLCQIVPIRLKQLLNLKENGEGRVAILWA